MFARGYRYVKHLSQRWALHRNSASAAAVAYYAVFALAPILVVATAVAGWVIGDADARALVERRLAETLGPAGAQVTRAVLTDARLSGHGLVASIVSGLLMLYGASAMFKQLRLALDEIFGRAVRAARAPLVNTLLDRGFAVLFVVVSGVLLVTLLLLAVVLQATVARLATWGGVDAGVWQWIASAVSFLVMAGVLLATYKFLPSARPPVRSLWGGVLVATMLMEVGRALFGTYIARSFVASAYGPSTALVAFVVWTYFASRFVLLGAEIAAASWHEAIAATEGDGGDPSENARG